MHQQVPSQSPPYQQQVPPQGWPQHGHATPPGRRRPARILFWVFVAVQVLTVLVMVGAGAQQTSGTTFDVPGSGAAVDVALVAGLWLWRQTGGRG